MLIEHLCRIAAFEQLPTSEIEALARKVSVLCLPSNRALLRPHQDVSGYFFLLKGAIQTTQPTTKVRARRRGHLVRFYPGCASAKTLTSCQVLRIDAAHYDFLVHCVHTASSMSNDSTDAWLARFLGSHMMRNLPSRHWQKLLASFSHRIFEPGARVLSKGDTALECYVIESGHAVVHDDVQTLCHLGPGDFFGEDALVLGGQRTAHVSALETLKVQAVGEAIFSNLLVESLVQFVARRGNGILLTLVDEHSVDATIVESENGSVPLTLTNIRCVASSLSLKETYYVAGGSRCERALCALLLIQRGLRAHPLEH